MSKVMWCPACDMGLRVSDAVMREPTCPTCSTELVVCEPHDWDPVTRACARCGLEERVYAEETTPDMMGHKINDVVGDWLAAMPAEKRKKFAADMRRAAEEAGEDLTNPDHIANKADSYDEE